MPFRSLIRVAFFFCSLAKGEPMIFELKKPNPTLFKT